ncbi:uncharacterized protein KGF55_004145 [Candida pseudojiufengensis]|uniref:uncharacterized protein n=1 Tax=Candida pseudojiufengensis TaxID=497109 RepID=UPI00222509AD|nr:uncharacterized protein KGF55_004145 [Candida pseudojiufengensis]KAI5961220.1 hypothetical protein KGF55_004145 [Candida pseudojiufengensis]
MNDDNNSAIDTDSFGNTITPPNLIDIPKKQSIFINDLPDEILIQILSQLDPLLLNNLRLVCKKWNYIMNDKETWIRSFQIRFGIQSNMTSFPSVTNSNNWMNEYFSRLQIMKNWKRGNSIHQSYRLIVHEYDDLLSLCDFKMNKICLLDKRSTNISFGNLDSGKNQSFIPGDNAHLENLTCCINWNYLVIGKSTGDIVLKNLITSTSLSQRVSFIIFDVPEEEKSAITAITMNQYVDKNAASVDVISGSFNGLLQCWSINGQLKLQIDLKESIYNVNSDFKNYIITNTRNHLYVLDFETLNILNKVELGINIVYYEDPETIVSSISRNTLNVDYGGKSIVITFMSLIKVFNFHDVGVRTLTLKNGVRAKKVKFQTCYPNKILNRNENIIGSDGLLVGVLLNDDSIMVWNIRENSNSSIVPQYRIYPELNYKKLSSRLNYEISRLELSKITTFALNSSILAVSGYNGLTYIYDVFTGKFLREISIKFPKRFEQMHHHLQFTTEIKLNPDPFNTNGLIICGEYIQYFQFGELINQNKSNKSKKPKQINLGVHNKHESKKKITDGMDEYNRQLNQQKQTNQLFDKYNGTIYDDDEEEMRIALAMSENLHSNQNEEMDEDLKLALELSMIENNYTM